MPWEHEVCPESRARIIFIRQFQIEIVPLGQLAVTGDDAVAVIPVIRPSSVGQKR
jgi:hypothetical protein